MADLTPTADIKKRMSVQFVEGGAHNPMGARGIYLFQGSKDTLFRIHGTNQPEYIAGDLLSIPTSASCIDFNRARWRDRAVLAQERRRAGYPPRMAAASPYTH